MNMRNFLFLGLILFMNNLNAMKDDSEGEFKTTQHLREMNENPTVHRIAESGGMAKFKRIHTHEQWVRNGSGAVAAFFGFFSLFGGLFKAKRNPRVIAAQVAAATLSGGNALRMHNRVERDAQNLRKFEADGLSDVRYVDPSQFD